MYATALRRGAGPIGPPPAARRTSGLVPPAKPHIEPAPFDVANDPGWQGILDPNDHELRNFLNQITPEERQMLLQRVQTLTKMQQPGVVPPGVPPDAQQAMATPGMGLPGITTRPAPAVTPPGP